MALRIGDASQTRLRLTIAKSEVQQPGKRGGKFYRDKKGHVHYGTKPNEQQTYDHEGREVGPSKGTTLTQEKLKRLGKGQGRHVQLTRAELDEVLKTGKYALVSAGPNPKLEADKHLSEDEIKARHKQLGEDLKEDGFAYTQVTGHYDGAEDTYLVMIHDANREHVRKLGEKYNQDSVIYGENGKQEMHFTYGEHSEKKEMHAGEGHEIKEDATNYYTIVDHPDGSHTKFALNFDWDHHLPRVEKSMKLLLKKSTGEGSRGGKIVGHTKSGHPIYDTHAASRDVRDKIEAEYNAHSEALKQYPKGPTGLTPDHAKTPEWHATKAKQAKAFAALQDYNGEFTKRFSKEIRAERDAARAAKLKKSEEPDDASSESESSEQSEEGSDEKHEYKPVDAPVGYGPRVVRVPMHDGADLNPAVEKEKNAMKPNVKKATAIEYSLPSAPAPEPPPPKQPAPTPDVKKATGHGFAQGQTVHHNSSASPNHPSDPQGTVGPRTTASHVHFMPKDGGKPRMIPHDEIHTGETMQKSEGKKGGAGSRGGKIAYYTKSGAAVYQSKVQKMAPGMTQMANNWSNNAGKSNSKDDHATAAKQHLAAAFYAHHAGDSEGAKSHLARASFHRTTAEHGEKIIPGLATQGTASKRTLSWYDKNKDHTHALVHGTGDTKKSMTFSSEFHEDVKSDLSKAINANEGDTMGNAIDDLFKSAGVEAGNDDIRKGGEGVHFVADDNDNPHDGGTGQVEGPRAGAGVSENDVIAPLLKSCKGAEAGDGEEFVITKSEMSTMGMSTAGLEGTYFTITKSEMKRLGAEQHIAYLADRKSRILKSATPSVRPAQPKSEDTISKAVPRGYTPRAGGVTGAHGEPLVQWQNTGADAEIAKYIETNGGYGQGSDELSRTRR